MKRESCVKHCLVLVVAIYVLTVSALAAAGPRLQVLHSFTGGTDGNAPMASLVSDVNGNLYGTTTEGGISKHCFTGLIGCGVVFELSPPQVPGDAWKETVLYRFQGGADGGIPAAGLVLDTDGNLYGTTKMGGNLNISQCSNGSNTGCGVVFQLSPQQEGNWRETAIHTFIYSDGGFPAGNLIFDLSGNLYGTTEIGGGAGAGTVFELSPNGSQGWSESTIYQFSGAPDGALPLAGVVLGLDGSLFGTTEAGGLNGVGSVFELTPPTQGGSWAESVIYSFSDATSEPRAALVFDNAGNLYGTTGSGSGTVYQLTPSVGGSWTSNELYAFGSGQSAWPWSGLIFDNAGNLYGTAAGKYCGAIFRLQDKGGLWSEAELDFFSGHQGPCNPESSLIFGKWGAAYGTSLNGGACKHGYCGTVFGILQ